MVQVMNNFGKLHFQVTAEDCVVCCVVVVVLPAVVVLFGGLQPE